MTSERITDADLMQAVADAVAHIERMERALHRILQWSEAYPLDIFPEPDFQKARDVLSASGLSLDQISASNMRHVINGVAEIARTALRGNEK